MTGETALWGSLKRRQFGGGPDMWEWHPERRLTVDSTSGFPMNGSAYVIGTGTTLPYLYATHEGLLLPAPSGGTE